MAKVMLAMLWTYILLWYYGVCGRTLDIAVKTIKTSAGDIFDCVDIYKQPAFDHPLLKDHKILMKPNVIFQNSPEVQMDSYAKDTALVDVELEGGGCPEGTVPVHRLPKTNSTDITTQWELDDQSSPNTMIALRRSSKRPYYGASAMINVYGVDQIGEGQQSTSMIWLRNEDEAIPTRGTIRAGWVVIPDKYNDRNTRMVIAYSHDGDQHLCYNLECPGFVQVNHKVALGYTISPLSVYEADQYYIYCHMYMDDKKNWWFALGDFTNVVGYWPAEVFTNMDHVSVIDFGGLVTCRQGPRWPLCPPMGSGHGSAKSPGEGCLIRQSQVVGPDHKWGGMSYWKQHHVFTDYGCYGVGTYLPDQHGYMFTFGGACET